MLDGLRGVNEGGKRAIFCPHEGFWREYSYTKGKVLCGKQRDFWTPFGFLLQQTYYSQKYMFFD